MENTTRVNRSGQWAGSWCPAWVVPSGSGVPYGCAFRRALGLDKASQSRTMSGEMSTVTTSERARLSGWRVYARDLWSRREFAWFLAIGNLKARNASTSLGLLWWIVNPLLLSAVYWGRVRPDFRANVRD